MRTIFALVVMALIGRGGLAQDYAKEGAPGPEHEKLKTFVGKWELTVEGVKEKGSVEFKSILGGRFLMEDAKVPFGGFSMEWHGVYGYDKRKKQYTGVWFDNMDVTTESGKGEWKDNGLLYEGEHLDHQGKPQKFQWRVTSDGKETLTIEMFTVDKDGKATQVMKVDGKKAK